tara:strand:+ start:1018 stop:1458 length:441 start_codon:yes stop_codon:yes gene_type:complete
LRKSPETWALLLGAAFAVYWTSRKKVMLSENFSLDQLIESKTARDNDLRNIPGPAAVENLNRLAVTVLEPLRDAIGDFRITSGFRTAAVNALLPQSVPNSKHISGRGIDIASHRYDAYQLVGVIKSSRIPYTQLIPYADGHVHIAI